MTLTQVTRAIIVAVTMALVPVAASTAHATTINCQHAGPIVGHPGMEYICYVVHDNNHRETFYAPGPVVRP